MRKTHILSNRAAFAKTLHSTPCLSLHVVHMLSRHSSTTVTRKSLGAEIRNPELKHHQADHLSCPPGMIAVNVPNRWYVQSFFNTPCRSG